MKTKMILVQFLWQKNDNLTVAWLVYPAGDLPPAPLSGRRGYFAKLQRFQEFTQVHKRLGSQALSNPKSARPQRRYARSFHSRRNAPQA